MIVTDTVIITPEILGVIAELDEFKGAWRAFGTLAPERLNALRHVATIESIGSSTRIEGSTLPFEGTQQLGGDVGGVHRCSWLTRIARGSPSLLSARGGCAPIAPG